MTYYTLSEVQIKEGIKTKKPAPCLTSPRLPVRSEWIFICTGMQN